MSQVSINLTECTAVIKLTKHDEHPKVLQHVILEVTHPTLKDIATLSCLRIIRTRCQGDFLEIMDEDCDELHNFATTLFDKYTKVRPHLVEDGPRRGTGCWGRELNDGELIYITYLHVKPEYQGQGIGSWALQKFIASDHVQDEDTVICWPAPVGRHIWDLTVEERTCIRDRQNAFFRKNGFRRIGRTIFFGYSPNPDHPSRKISIDGDAETADENFPSTGPALTIEQRTEAYPLHVAVFNKKNDMVTAEIRRHHAADPSSIHKADENGFTPIFVAASAVNLPVVRQLLEYGVADDLTSCANKDGLTPLEALRNSMTSTREFSETLLSRWDGYRDDELAIEYLLKRAMGHAVNAATVEEYKAKQKWGCTCGVCAGGWLSPRMRFHLACQAALAKDLMEDEMEFFTRSQPLSPDSLFSNWADFLPPHMTSNLFKTAYKGYQSIFNGISTFLETTVLEPTPSSLAPYYLNAGFSFHNGVLFYIEKGGQPEYAWDAVTHLARSESSLGDGTFEELWEDEDQVGTDYTGLPRCANDLEFDLVRRNVGLDPKQRWGPYTFLGRELDADGDSVMDSKDEHDDDDEGDEGWDAEVNDMFFQQSLATMRGFTNLPS